MTTAASFWFARLPNTPFPSRHMVRRYGCRCFVGRNNKKGTHGGPELRRAAPCFQGVVDPSGHARARVYAMGRSGREANRREWASPPARRRRLSATPGACAPSGATGPRWRLSYVCRRRRRVSCVSLPIAFLLFLYSEASDFYLHLGYDLGVEQPWSSGRSRGA